MPKRFTSLSFIIGSFFVLIAIVLLVGFFISQPLAFAINLYAGIVFLVFGFFMIMMSKEED